VRITYDSETSFGATRYLNQRAQHSICFFLTIPPYFTHTSHSNIINTTSLVRYTRRIKMSRKKILYVERTAAKTSSDLFAYIFVAKYYSVLVLLQYLSAIKLIARTLALYIRYQRNFIPADKYSNYTILT